MLHLPTNHRLILGTLHDAVMAGASLVLAFWLRLGLEGAMAHSHVLFIGVPVYAVIAVPVFKSFGMNRGLWRYASVADLMAILKAVTVSLLIFVPVMFQLTRLEDFPRSVMAIQWLLLVMMLGGPRLIYRALRDQRVLRSRGVGEGQPQIPVLVVGTGDGADLFIRSAQKDLSGRYRVAGIIDDRGRRLGGAIHHVPILGTPENLTAIVESLKKQGLAPQRLIFTDSTTGDLLKTMAPEAEKLGLCLARLPGLTEFREGLDEGNLELRPIAIEDLLGRPQAPLDLEAIRAFIAGRRVLVTGAGGSIGSELTRQIASFAPAALCLVDNCEFNLYEIDQEMTSSFHNLATQAVLADVRDAGRILRLFENFRPEVVFHAAALKHVPMVEMNPSEGILTNVRGTRSVADAARACGALAMVQVSTDKAVNPTNVMGATKRLGEYYCQALDIEAGRGAPSQRTHFMTVRFGNVMGSSGSVVPLFRRQLAKGGPLTVTHPDIKRYFMTVREAVGLILQASARGIRDHAQRGQIFVLDMGEPVRISDIARRMIRLANLEPDKDIKIIYTGLRPGEKLFEELFDAGESPAETGIPGTLAAIPKPIDLQILRRFAENIEASAESGDIEKALMLLKSVIPGYMNTPAQKTDAARSSDTAAQAY